MSKGMGHRSGHAAMLALQSGERCLGFLVADHARNGAPLGRVGLLALGAGLSVQARHGGTPFAIGSCGFQRVQRAPEALRKAAYQCGTSARRSGISGACGGRRSGSWRDSSVTVWPSYSVTSDESMTVRREAL